jgi:hypothetical protein
LNDMIRGLADNEKACREKLNDCTEEGESWHLYGIDQLPPCTVLSCVVDLVTCIMKSFNTRYML